MNIWQVKLPFTLPVRHNLADHRSVDNIIVAVTTSSGAVGYGEGIPRSFVTGETLTASLNFLKTQLVPRVISQRWANPRVLRDFLADLWEESGAAATPAAFCALETALLDAAGQSWGMTVAVLLELPACYPVVYSAVLPLASPEHMTHFWGLIKKFQIRHVKVKVGTPDDEATVRATREALGPDVDLRIDANAAWSPEVAIAQIRRLAPYRLSAVEQPVAKDDIDGMRLVSQSVDIPVIADESLCSAADARRLIQMGACQILNIRISKCGGLTQAVNICRLAQEAGLKCQLGSHVGETSLLAAAGRHFAMGLPQLCYVEGSLAPLYLSQDLVDTPVFFGPGGRGPALPTPGLGVRVIPEVLQERAEAYYSFS